jgi:hypothetical protein
LKSYQCRGGGWAEIAIGAAGIETDFFQLDLQPDYGRAGGAFLDQRRSSARAL